MPDRKQHWDKIYTEKQPHEVSWTQAVPHTSLHFIRAFHLPKSAHIIDIGGGDSTLVDFLLEDGYEHITVLDISAQALERAQKRIGPRAEKVNWVVTDILGYTPTEHFDLWHDRAAFHFLTTAEQIHRYIATARASVTGFLTIGTFSHEGPAKCSGLDIKQYNEEELQSELAAGFTKLRCITEDHTTPFNTKQNFLFCSFRAKHMAA